MTNISIGDVAHSTVVIGNENFVVHLENVEAGATVNIVKPDSRPRYTPKPQPVELLPRPFPALVGRDKELSALHSDVQNSATVSLWARKGMGKTSIARALTNALNQEDSARSVVYLDALRKGRDDLLQALFDTFFDSADSYLPSPGTIPSALQKVKSLVFVDNLSLSGDDVESLLNAAPGCSFVLISNERAVFGEGEALALKGLADADAVGLFEKQFGRPLDDAEKEVAGKICAFLEGCPDDIIRTAAQGAAAQKTPVQLLMDLRAAGTDAKALATVATADLSDTDRRILAYLAAAGENVVPSALLQTAFLGVDISAEMERLKSLNLVQSHSPRYSLCGMLGSGLSSLWDLTTWRDSLLNDSIRWLSESKDLESIQSSVGMLLQAITDAADRKKWAETIRLGRLLERHLVTFKRWEAWADVLNVVLGGAQAVLDRATEAWALHQLGSGALVQGYFELAGRYLHDALQIREALHDQAGAAITRHNLDVLKEAASSSRGQKSGKRPSGGGRSLAFGILGAAGLVLIATGAYALVYRGQRSSPTKALAPPPVVSSPTASFTPSGTPTLTLTPTLTGTPTGTPTDTPTWTPSPTGTPFTPAPFTAVVTADFLACKYGPGAAYLYYYTLSKGNVVSVLGRADTAYGPWLYVKYTPTYRLKTNAPLVPCWVNPNYLALKGDISTLQQYYPDKAPLILFQTNLFPPPSNVSANRDGNLVTITWDGFVLALGDREAKDSPRFLVETWSCIAGKIVFTPMGIETDLFGQDLTTVSESAQVQDDAGCSEPSHGQVYLAHKDGYIGPVPIPWPQQ